LTAYIFFFFFYAVQLTGKQIEEYESRHLGWDTMKYQELVYGGNSELLQ